MPNTYPRYAEKFFRTAPTPAQQYDEIRDSLAEIDVIRRRLKRHHRSSALRKKIAIDELGDQLERQMLTLKRLLPEGANMLERGRGRRAILGHLAPYNLPPHGEGMIQSLRIKRGRAPASCLRRVSTVANRIELERFYSTRTDISIEPVDLDHGVIRGTVTLPYSWDSEIHATGLSTAAGILGLEARFIDREGKIEIYEIKGARLSGSNLIEETRYLAYLQPGAYQVHKGRTTSRFQNRLNGRFAMNDVSFDVLKRKMRNDIEEYAASAPSNHEAILRGKIVSDCRALLSRV